MTFAQTETQILMAQMLSRFLDKENAFEARRHRLAANAPDRLALWRGFADLGILGAFVPEEFGGYGGGKREMAVVMAEAGRSLVVEPCIHAAMAVEIWRAVAKSGDRALAQKALADIVHGRVVFCFAAGNGHAAFDPTPMTAARRNGATLLSGEQSVVRHADVAGILLIFGTCDGAPAVFALDAGAAGASIETYRNIDGSGGGRLRCNDAQANVILSGEPARSAAEAALSTGILAMAAETVGTLDALNSATCDFLRTREQFGVPLASFQALQHRAADMYIATEELRETMESLIAAADSEPEPLSTQSYSGLKILADLAAARVSHDAVQLHGGMGVSDELDVSHYLRRHAAMRAELGTTAFHKARYRASGSGLGEKVFHNLNNMPDFRRDIRDFTTEHLSGRLRKKGANGHCLEKADYVEWERCLRRKGWFAAAWPKRFGGADWSLEKQLVFRQETALNHAPMVVPYGVNMIGPVLQKFGTPVQQEKYLTGILESRTWWCQGYSEPGAGSDLASLKTSAVRDGDVFVVNGTKMWTTEGHWADMMHCLVRTGSGGKSRDGITFLLIDMRSPGISLSPILTLDGQHHTNQTFLDNVRVPVENVVGEVGQGWQIAKFLLSHERAAIADTGPKLRLLAKIRSMLDLLEKTPEGAPIAAQLAMRFTEIEIALWSLVSLEKNYVAAWSAGKSPDGPEASLLKIRGTEILQDLTQLAMDLEGPFAAIHDPGDLNRDPEETYGPTQEASALAHQYLYSRCWSIFGGTNEIQRNIIARSIGLT